ncbi:hypothetical protein NUU61_002931 [Penicillium alfredii]|uniref:Protein kinase domain-containing protein n=1 Tax=Penicillium alfredii TaxID=1506179 RepID=A0A9W9KGE2_9EURO|nr:uncharacterized protein NUU61_002931 [Penicillium alfredii]KAJ5105584.1 hypothetical protein NUU61_002931 [Penicillium alfredii]
MGIFGCSWDEILGGSNPVDAVDWVAIVYISIFNDPTYHHGTLEERDLVKGEQDLYDLSEHDLTRILKTNYPEAEARADGYGFTSANSCEEKTVGFTGPLKASTLQVALAVLETVGQPQDHQNVVVKNTSVPADSMADAAERWDMLQDGVSMLQGAEYQRQVYELPGGPKYFVNAVDWYFYLPLRVAALLTPRYPTGDLEQVLDRTWPDGFYYRNWEAFRDFLVGVQILHDKLGITHRDLKPANPLVKENHGGYLITDFDFATTKRTISGQQHVGSPIYKAPEADLKEKNAVSEKMDVFSVTQIMLKVLGLCPPESRVKKGNDPAKQVWKAAKRLESPMGTKSAISGILKAQRDNVPGMNVAHLNEWVQLASKGLCRPQDRLNINQFIEEFDKTLKVTAGM